LTHASLPLIGEASVDGRVLGFAATIAFASSVIFGLLPALHVSRPDLRESLKEAGRGAVGGRGSRTQRALVILEVALSLVLLAGAGLLIKSIGELQGVDPGFVPSNVLAVDLSLPNRYATPEARAAFFQEVAERMQELPGVAAAGVTSHLPLSGEDGGRRFRIWRDSAAPSVDLPTAEYRRVTPRYFKAMGIPVIHGRAFTEADTATAPGVVIVNRALAQRFFPGEDALGQRLWIEDGSPRLREVVGVVGDVRHFGLDAAARPEMYIPQVDRPWPNMTLVVKAASGPPGRLIEKIRREIMAMDESVPVADVKTMDRYLADSTAQRWMTVRFVGVFAVAALLMASLGLHGLMSYAVTQRIREVAIRMALGARRAQVVSLVVGDGLRLVAIGLSIGLCAVFMLAPVIASQLYGVGAHDPIVLLCVGGLLAGVASAACYLPARRAARTDPMVCARL
jgi:predicted permease